MALESSSSRPAEAFGRYTLFGEIASGGMASVHIGRLSGQAGFARTVAIKRLHPQFAKDPEFVAMFLDEARLTSRIRHPNVVPTLDVVAISGELLVVMDYIHGEAFSRLLRTCRTQKIEVPLRVLAAIMTNVLHGLHAAHEARSESGEPLAIVHRDVSPHNVLVGLDGVAYVLDFGVAKAASRVQTTREGLLKGKLAYMSSEQIASKNVDRRTDVYAAGVVLWEAIAGRRLFEADNDFALAELVRFSEVDPPSKHRPTAMAFDAVTMRAIDRDPAARYATAREMANALEDCVGVASAREVADWVTSIAGDVLLERSEMVSGVEKQTAKSPASTPSIGTPSTAPPAPTAVVVDQPSSGVSPSEPPTIALQPLPVEEGTRSVVHTFARPAPVSNARLGAIAAVVGGSVLAIGLTGLYLRHREEAPVAASHSVAAEASATPASLATEPASSAAPATEAPKQTSAPPASAPEPVVSAAPSAHPPSKAKPIPAPPRPDCADPYYTDDRGIKRIKRQCVPH